MFIEIKNIKKDFGTGDNITHALKDVSFAMEKGEMIVLLGPSGSGKSTLLNIIGGIESSDSGIVEINGEGVHGMSEKERIIYRRNHLGYVFQSYNLIPNAKQISMMKILGYKTREINRAYNIPTGIMVIISVVINTLICQFLIRALWDAILKLRMRGWVSCYFAPYLFPLIMGLGIASYIVVYFIESRKISKIELSKTLKEGSF